MFKAIVFAGALATAGAGAVYAQATGGAPGETSGTTMGPGAGSSMRGPNATGGATTGAPARLMTTLPPHAMAVSNWYDQNVYDQQDKKLGEIKDMLLDRGGKVEAVIVSVGGFLGIGEKDVAVPFDAVTPTQRENKFWLTMNVNKDELRSAPGFRYDRSKQEWTVAQR